MNISKIQESDPEMARAIISEGKRQQDKIELIASENYVSGAVMEALGTCLTNKYAEGYPQKRYYGGCECVDEVETLAIERLVELFGADGANVQAHSGASANLAAFFAFLNPGDTYLGMSLNDGGHLTHGSAVNISGKYFNPISYGLDDSGRIDYDNVLKLAFLHKPKLILAGASSYSREIDFKTFREIADKVGAYLMVDMAHIAGLVATGLHNSPIGLADVVTTTTHKTLRGPRGGAIIFKKEYENAINKAIFPGCQGGPLMHVIAAKGVCFKEAMKPEFAEYQRQVLKNSKTLEAALKEHDIDLISGGTDNHLLLLNLTKYNKTGREISEKLDEIGISVNRNAIPKDTQSPFHTSGIRIGTPAATTRGMKEGEMKIIADIIIRTIKEYNTTKEESKKRIKALCEKFPVNVIN